MSERAAAKIGIVDLDTSHPQHWIPILRDLGHEIVGIYDSGDIHPAGYAQRFAEQLGIDNVYDDLEELAKDADVAVIHSCDWDRHAERAEPFARAGKGLLIDKPFAGNLRDLERFLSWERQGVRIAGGSSLRWCSEVSEWRGTHQQEHIVAAFAGCSVDEFNYGIHAYSMLQGIMGPGIRSVRHLGEHVQRQVEIVWNDGRRGQVLVGAAEGYLPFYATVVTQTDVSHLIVDNTKLYAAMLGRVMPYVAGTDSCPAPLEELFEAEKAAIAGEVSRMRGGAPVLLEELDPAFGYDGAAFADIYRRNKYANRRT